MNTAGTGLQIMSKKKINDKDLQDRSLGLKELAEAEAGAPMLRSSSQATVIPLIREKHTITWVSGSAEPYNKVTFQKYYVNLR